MDHPDSSRLLPELRFLTQAVLAAMLLAAPPCTATDRWALLIGIADYQHLQDLEGPANDVASLAALLVDQWGFNADAVRTLVNKEATRTSILNELDSLYAKSVPGDEVLIYFSGHGTSRFDPRQPWPLPHTSAALIPVDFVRSGTIEEQTRQLLVGRTDLRPALASLDNGQRLTVVAVDACFSENAVRAVTASGLTAKYQPLDAGRQTKPAPMAPSDREKTFPFSNVFFIAAAGEHEFAFEIGREALADYPTIDGQAHGVFTNALLTAMSKAPPGGPVTLGELASDIQHAIDLQAFPQNIRTLSGYDAMGSFRSHPLFGRQRRTATELLQTLVARAPATSLTVAMTLAGDADPRQLREATEISVDITTNTEAFLILLNIAPDDEVNLLYPQRSSAQLPERARFFSVPDLAKQQPMVIGPPFGIEQIIALAFTELPASYDLLFSSNSGHTAVSRFLAVLADEPKSRYSVTSLQLRTIRTDTIANDGAQP